MLPGVLCVSACCLGGSETSSVRRSRRCGVPRSPQMPVRHWPHWQHNLATEPGNRTRHLPGFLTFVSSPACKTIAMSPYGSDSKQFPVFRTSELELATCINDEHLKLSCSGTGNGCHVSPWYSFQRISGPLPPLQVLVPY